MLTEKKEERSSNASRGRSASPLCLTEGRICWFSGPRIINFKADDSKRNPRPAHDTHAQIHTRASACADAHEITRTRKEPCVYTHAHKQGLLHNK